ncbi:MAG: hypothetical protein AB7S38_14800 [Vulcanimicrobiota bacterium]
MSFEGFVCWKESDARAILATEALEGSEAAFLATHLPISDFEVQGVHGADIQEATEQALLDVLSTPERRHAFCVVEGEPGSGKSHLIRWLGVRWPRGDDLVLLIQRADGSLEGTLEQLTRKVPERYAHLFAGLGSRQEASLRGRARLFLSTLARTLEEDYFEEDVPHAEWCANFQLSDLFDNPAVRDNWRTPGRILDIYSGRTNSELGFFTLKDIAELADLESRIQNEKPPPKAFRFIRTLAKEGRELRNFLEADYTESEIKAAAGDKLVNTFTLVDALNVRLNHAIQNLIGISSHGLRELFLRLRRELKKDNRRLVLLLEDITNFQGIDQQLIDALVTQSTTRTEDDLCDLVSAVGITPAYFERYLSTMGNYIERITYHVRLGREQEGSHMQDVASLRNPEAQVQFAANYLRATRAGLERLEQWAGSQDQSVPNVCLSCQHRSVCHGAFGAADGVGLYPFTAGAITGMFHRLVDPHAATQTTHQTPRGMLQGVLTPTLMHPHVIEEQEFPSPHADVPWIPEERRRLRGDHKQFLAVQVQDLDTRQRLERLIELWGTRDHVETTKDEAGELLFAGLSRGVYEAFSLPWLGDAQRALETPAPPPPPVAVEQPRVHRVQPSAPSPKKSRTEVIPSEKRATPKKVRVDLDIRRDQLANWLKDGGRLEDAEFWAAQVQKLLDLLPWAHLDVSPAIRRGFFTSNLIHIERSGTARRAYHFVIPAEKWLADGLEVFIAIEAGTAEVSEFQRRCLARALSQLKRLVLRRVAEVIPSVEGRPWSVAGSATQLLVAMEWLGKGASPEQPLVEQWIRVRDDQAPGAPSKERTQRWRRVAELSRHRSVLRNLLASFITLRDGTVFLDAADACTALERLRRTFSFDATPDLPDLQHWADMKKLGQRAQDSRADFQLAARDEIRRLRDGCQELDEYLRQNSLSEHVKRIDSVLEGVQRVDVLTTNRPREWHDQRGALEDAGLIGPSPALDICGFLDETLERDGEFSSPLDAFLWCRGAPAEALQLVLSACRSGEALVADLFTHVQTYGDVRGGEASLSKVHERGEWLKSVGDALRAQLEVKSEV